MTAARTDTVQAKAWAKLRWRAFVRRGWYPTPNMVYATQRGSMITVAMFQNAYRLVVVTLPGAAPEVLSEFPEHTHEFIATKYKHLPTALTAAMGLARKRKYGVGEWTFDTMFMRDCEAAGVRYRLSVVRPTLDSTWSPWIVSAILYDGDALLGETDTIPVHRHFVIPAVKPGWKGALAAADAWRPPATMPVPCPCGD